MAAGDLERPAGAGKQDAGAGEEAELRAEAPCWEAAPVVLVSGNRGAAGRAGGGRALSEDGGPSAAWGRHPEA